MCREVCACMCSRTAGMLMASVLATSPPCTQGDVQMAVSMLLVLGEQGKSLVDTGGHAQPNSTKLASGEVIQFLTMYFGELSTTHLGAHF